MPTDLTGTPTSLGIGTYNVDADAPSGLGFNEAMAQIDALIAARATKPSGIVSGEGMVWNGTGWDRSSVTKLGTSSLSGYPWKDADIDPAAAIAASKLASGIPASKLSGYPTNGGVFLAGDGTWKAAGGTTYRKTTAKAVTNTVAETDLLNGEITIGAGVMGANSVLRLTAVGDGVFNGNSTAPQWKLKLGATTLIDTGALVWQTMGTNRLGWKLAVELFNLGATNSQWINFLLKGSADYPGNGVAINSRAAGFVTGEGAYLGWGNATASSKGFLYEAEGGNTGAVDTTVAQSLVFSVINGFAGASYETKLYGALVEIV